MEAKIINVADVGIDSGVISENALSVVEQLQSAGFQAYLVGGCVRDLILGSKPKDFDVASNATPEQIKSIFKNSRIIGRRFKLVHVRFGYEVIEVATFRADANDRDDVSAGEMQESEEGQLLRDNIFGTIEEDVVRRDFRANALYLDPASGQILDFVGGLEDIKAKKLVSIGEPIQRFREDPVRMLRVVRFAAKLGFSMEPKALEMIENEGKLLSNVSAARLFEEVLKLFHGGAAFETYKILCEYGLFQYLFPFTNQGLSEATEGMPERALQNTDTRIKEGKPVIPAFLFACLLWDPVKADAQTLIQDGMPETQAWRIAMKDGLRDQNQYVAVPRRLADIILDIWNIHFRLIKRNPRMIKTSLNNRRFRAGYDFLLLRVALHEVDQEIGDWWTKIQEVEADEIEQMIDQAGEIYHAQRRQHFHHGEANGNRAGYRDEWQPQSRAQYAGGRSNWGNRHGGGGHPANRNNGYRRAPRRDNDDWNGGYSRPKDDFGNYQFNDNENQGRQKKVKVRRKKRIIGNASDTDRNPHF